MAIYYGANRIALGAKFMPPREGSMPERITPKTLGPDQYQLKGTERAAKSTGMFLKRSKK